MEPTIRLRGVTKVYPSTATTAVAGIDLDIGPGEVVALLGPNGAGKSTTLDLILGFAQPTEGRVEVFGRSPRRAVTDGRVSAVLQSGGLLRDLTFGETVDLIASTHPRADPAGAVRRAGIDRLLERRVQSCSGGEQQRLRFALALLGDPDLLLLDEPTAGMDVEGRRDFWAAMSAEADRGRTIVFATHYLQEAEDAARRTVLLAGGRVVADGPTEQVRRQASGRTVHARIDRDRIGPVAERLATFDGVHGSTVDGDRLTVETTDSDAVARLLLGELGGTDLEIRPASLEAAFVLLTGGDASGHGDRPSAHPALARA